MRVKFLLAVLLLANTVSADSDPSLNRKVSAAEERLKNTPTFAFGGIGIAGRISQGEQDFTLLMSQPPAAAEAALRRVLREGTAEGKAYAVVGLRTLRPAEGEALQRQLHAVGKIATQRGCIRSLEPAEQAVDGFASFTILAER